eukprot:1180824-Prorocentrum_minimum.AAC.3
MDDSEKPGPKKKQVVTRLAVKPKTVPKPKPDAATLHPALRPVEKDAHPVEKSDGEDDENAGGGLGALMTYGSSDSEETMASIMHNYT